MHVGRILKGSLMDTFLATYVIGFGFFMAQNTLLRTLYVLAKKMQLN
jgi:hypothetical protein